MLSSVFCIVAMLTKTGCSTQNSALCAEIFLLIVELPKLIFVSLDVRLRYVGINLAHNLIVAPSANLHCYLHRDSQVSRKGRKTMAKLVDGDTLDSGTGTYACHGVS